MLAEVWGHCLLCGIYCCLHKVVPLTTATAIATFVIATIPYPRQSQLLKWQVRRPQATMHGDVQLTGVSMQSRL